MKTFRLFPKNLRRLILLSLLITGICFPEDFLNAQTTVTVADGDAPNLDIPIDCYYNFSYSEQIYLQSEINVSGDITSLYFEYNGHEAFTDDIKIYMGHTSKSSFSSTSDWVTSAGMTEVYDGTISVTTTEGWVTITLDNAFTYNNSDNLVIAVDENTPTYHSSQSNFIALGTGATTSRSNVYSNDFINPAPGSPPSGYVQNYVPSLKLDILSCIAPSATSSVVENCNAGTFTVDVSVSSYGDASSADLTDGATTFTNAVLNTVYTFGPYNTSGSATIQYNGDAYGGCDDNSGTLGGCVPNTCGDAVDLSSGNIVADFSLAKNDSQESDSGGESNFLQVGNGTTIASCASGFTHNAYDYTEYKDLWYKVTVPSGEDEFTLTFSNINGNYVVIPYYGSCGSLTQMTLLYNSDQSITGVIDNDGNNWFGDDPFVTSTITSLDFKGNEILNAPGGLVYLRIFPFDGGQGGSSGCDANNFSTASLTINSSIQPPATRTTVSAGNFNTASTWDCTCVPGADENVVIAHDITQDVDYTQNTDLSFVVNTDKILTIQNSYTLTVAGDLTNLGQIKGRLKLNGSSSQSVDLGIIQYVEVDNTAGVTLTDNANIARSLTLTAGVVTTGGNELKLRSTSTFTALIVEGAGSISGDVKIQRYIPDAVIGHHYLSSPMTSILLSELSDDFSFDLTGAYPNIYYYNESISSWVVPSAESDAMVLGRGYTGYFAGDDVIDVEGTPNSGATEINLTSAEDGWNFIGNPYPAPIDWDLVTVPSGMANAIYVWDHDPSSWGSYTTYVDGIGTNGGANVMPMMQGFFVKATSAVTLTLEDNDRITDPSNVGTFYKSSKTANDPLIRLELDGFGFQTEAVIRFKPNALNDYEPTVDALLFPNGNPLGADLASVSSDNEILVINTLSDSQMNTTIPLFTSIGTSGSYQIEMTEFDNFSGSYSVVLHDNNLATTHNLNNGPYIFNSSLSDGTDRFYIETIDLSVGLNDKPSVNTMSAFLRNGEINLRFTNGLRENSRISIYNVLGQNVYAKDLIKGNMDYIIPKSSLQTDAVYFIKIQNYHEIIKIFLTN